VTVSTKDEEQLSEDDIRTRQLDAAHDTQSIAREQTRSDLKPYVARPIEDTAPTPIPGRYLPGRLIGTGGMGDVWEVTDQRLGRRVALKLPRRGGADAHTMIAAEARVAAHLEHPSIVPVYDAGEEHGRPYYAMRLLEHPTLADVLGQRRAGDERARGFGLFRLLRYFIQVCQAVHYAHTRGVVHCDLKPANIVIGDFGQVVVLDWGMAFRLTDGSRGRGGTPGFMAPEQAVEGSRVDERADVYALGAILYEIVVDEPPYPPEVVEAVLRYAVGDAPFPAVPAPRARRPEVPIELDQVCVRATRVEPGDRYSTADDLAREIEAFLEGTKERDRRARRAAELIEEAEQLSRMYRDNIEGRAALVAEVAQTRAQVAPWEGAERKRALWDAEDRLATTDALAIRTMQASVAAFEQALDEQPGHKDARSGLAALFALEVERARLRRDELNRVYFEELVKQFADGDGTGARHEATLRVELEGASSAVTAFELEEQGRRIALVRPRPLGRAPVEVRLSPGSYVVALDGEDEPGRTSWPVLLSLGQTASVSLSGPALASLRPHERYVPGGPALLGGDESSPWGPELMPIDVPAFIVDARPVTVAQYLRFLEEVQRDDADALPELVPLSTIGTPSWRWSGARFEPEAVFDMTRAELLALPVFGVSLAAARSYAAWAARNTGLRYRLLHEAEWEKAARGVDGRVYPWGDYFDASFCKMYQSRVGAPLPEPPGTFEADRSPYGVEDTAGGISEWVIGVGSVAGRIDVARGGAWCDWSADCRLVARRPYQAGARASRVGFRLARST
jgi:eukaryotic-like serine/threonine-protein kinase